MSDLFRSLGGEEMGSQIQGRALAVRFCFQSGNSVCLPFADVQSEPVQSKGSVHRSKQTVQRKLLRRLPSEIKVWACEAAGKQHLVKLPKMIRNIALSSNGQNRRHRLDVFR